MDIYVLDNEFNILGLVDGYKSLMFTQNYSTVGDFQITIDNRISGAEILAPKRLIALGGDGKKSGIITSVVIELDEDGNEIRDIKGKTMGVLLSYRIIDTYLSEFDIVKDQAEAVIRHYVENNLINPTDSNRKIENVTQTEYKGLGEDIVWKARFSNLQEEVEIIAEQTGLGWQMYIDIDNKKVEFDVYKGKSLTVNDENPVIFSAEYGNIKSQSYMEDTFNERTTSYIGGEGEGAERRIYKSGEEYSGLNRKEIFIDVRAESGYKPPSEPIQITVPKFGQQPVENRGFTGVPPTDSNNLDGKIIDLDSEKLYEYRVVDTVNDILWKNVAIFATEITGLISGLYEIRERAEYGEYQNILEIGKLELQTYKTILSYDGQIYDTEIYKYERDYNIGDIVTVIDEKIGVLNIRISSVTEVYDDNGRSLIATFGDEILSLKKVIKNNMRAYEPYARK